jgi:hypothetical protein
LAYDFINEPRISADAMESWYGGNFLDLGIYYSPLIARGVTAGAASDAAAQAWLTQMSAAIKAIDPDALVTFGTLPYYTSYFGITNITGYVDFAQPHFYPEHPDVPPGILTYAYILTCIANWATAPMPVMCGETLSWSDSSVQNIGILDAVSADMEAMISYSYGYPPAMFTSPPDPVRFPAIGDGEVWISYADQEAALELFLTYRDGFLA